MGLHWGASHVERIVPLSIMKRIRSYADTDPVHKISEEDEEFLAVCNGKTGEVLARFRDMSTRRVSRLRLREVLSEGLDVRYGYELRDILVDDSSSRHDRVTAVFANGENIQGSCLVGCDSSSSFVRSWLLEPEKARCTEMPVISYNFTCTYTAEQASWLRTQVHPIIKCAPHPEQNTWYIIPILSVPNPEKPETWVFQHFMNLWTRDETPATSEQRLAHFKKLGKVYADPFKSAAEWVPDDTYVASDRIKHWPNATRWKSCGGKVTLAGDAAHPMCPYRAQGLNNAIRDAAEYVEAIERVLYGGYPDAEHMNGSKSRGLESNGSARKGEMKDSSEALNRTINKYDEEVFERGTREINVSAEQGYAAMHWDKYMESPRVKYGLRPTGAEYKKTANGQETERST